MDPSLNPALDDHPIDKSRANEPTTLILNVSFTDDLAQQEAAIQEIWARALCVSQAPIEPVRRGRR